MSSTPAPTRTRRSAAERREELVRIAIGHFALGGYHGTSTEAIARDAGISQPYLFRLFKTKRELFLACCDEADRRVADGFRAAARGVPRDEVLGAMGRAYRDFLADRESLLFQMQAYAACSDPVIQARVRDNYRALVMEVTRLSGAAPGPVWEFFSHGMLLNVVASLDLPSLAAGGDEWAAAWCSPPPPGG